MERTWPPGGGIILTWYRVDALFLIFLGYARRMFCLHVSSLLDFKQKLLGRVEHSPRVDCSFCSPVSARSDGALATSYQTTESASVQCPHCVQHLRIRAATEPLPGNASFFFGRVER